jgi:hypothetical protein
VVAALAVLAAPDRALAAPEACLSSIAGREVALLYDSADPQLKENRSARERLFGGRGRITCPGFVTLREMTPGLSDAERTPFCLTYDREAGTYSGFAVGPRDAWLGCRRPERGLCRHVNATADTAMAVTTAMAGAVLGTTPPARTAPEGTGSAILDAASGAFILSGAGSYVTSALGNAASSALAALSAPAALTAAAVTVVAVGGAVYVCSD